MPERRSNLWVFWGIIVILIGALAWRFLLRGDAPSSSGLSFSLPATAVVAENVADTLIAVPTTATMELSDPNQATTTGTLVVDGSSTAVSADGGWSASMEMIQEAPITYSFNDGAGPTLVVDDVYLLITNKKTGEKRQAAVLGLAPEGMIAAIKAAPSSTQYEYVTYDLAWTSNNHLTGRAELYDTTNGTDAPPKVQGIQFTVDPTTWTVTKK